MKKNKTKADKILKIFKAKFPLLTVTDIYNTKDATIVRAEKDPGKFKMGIPYYQLLPNGAVINANPFGNSKFFLSIVKEENKIYHNSEIDYPEVNLKKEDKDNE